jgi:hypothetical protein
VDLEICVVWQIGGGRGGGGRSAAATRRRWQISGGVGEERKKKKNDIENTNVYMQERERRIAILVGVTGRRIIQD